MAEKKNNLVSRILLIVFGSIFGLILLVFAGVNIAKYAFHGEYYSTREWVCTNPDINSGFIMQGLTYNDEDDSYIICGYMGNDDASRIYTVKDDEIKYFHLNNADDSPFYGHTGGIQYANGKIYLANEGYGDEQFGGIYVFDASLLDQENHSYINIGLPHKVINNSSFVYSDDDYLYVGDYNNDKSYISPNEFTYKEKTHRATIAKYTFDFELLEIYAIENKVQGCVVTNDGIITSVSSGLSFSSINFYKRTDFVDITTGDIPTYFVSEKHAEISLPPMSEDLDLVNGRIITGSESACNKYIFGKFLFDWDIYSLPLKF